MRLFLLFFLLSALPAHAFNPNDQTRLRVTQDPAYWEQRRQMMEGGKIKRIADKCQELTQHHSVMAERAAGWLYRFAVPYGGNNAFIDRPTHVTTEKHILRIHGWLQEENRWERHGAAVPGALDRCRRNHQQAINDVIDLMTKFGAIYVPEHNTWGESWSGSQ
ncbi:hypothetical protein [Terasakiella sp. SH-1]|uniref:hypothetical protein n=1 Tax=Terasakiella sp. SH-1 TaxID=2560057 RepID=UPI0010747733|nr:hypothetical protein [Terasakiella sp. SH-1]